MDPAKRQSIVRPFLNLWQRWSIQAWRYLPTPDDSPVIDVAGPAPFTVLLIGGGPALGWGVLTHQLGLGGHLARELSTMTKRGCRVDVVASEDTGPSEAAGQIRERAAHGYDVVVTTLGGREALEFTPARHWERSMNDLVRAAQASSAVTFVVGIAPITALVQPPALLRRHVRDRVARLNRITRSACEGSERVTFVPFEPASGMMLDMAGRDIYADWASVIAPAIVAVLTARLPPEGGGAEGL